MPKLELPLDLRPLLPITITDNEREFNRDINLCWGRIGSILPDNDNLEIVDSWKNLHETERNKYKQLKAGRFVEISGTLFTILNHIKSGTYGIVSKCLNHSTGQPVILKHILCPEIHHKINDWSLETSHKGTHLTNV